MRRTEIAQQRKLTDRVSRTGGNGGGADLLRAVMRSQSAGKQPVAICYMDQRIFCNSRHGERSGRNFRPYVYIVLRIAHNGQLTRRTGRRMHFDDIALVRRIKSERIRGAKIVLDGKRKFA